MNTVSAKKGHQAGAHSRMAGIREMSGIEYVPHISEHVFKERVKELVSYAHQSMWFNDYGGALFALADSSSPDQVVQAAWDELKADKFTKHFCDAVEKLVNRLQPRVIL